MYYFLFFSHTKHKTTDEAIDEKTQIKVPNNIDTFSEPTYTYFEIPFESLHFNNHHGHTSIEIYNLKKKKPLYNVQHS